MDGEAMKPADSDQIAKARRERAEKRMRELLFHAQSSNGTVPRVFSENHLTEVLYEFAASERQAVKEECCRAMCLHCKDSSHSDKYTGKAENIDGKWIHRELGFGPDDVFDCKAAAIRSME